MYVILLYIMVPFLNDMIATLGNNKVSVTIRRWLNIYISNSPIMLSNNFEEFIFLYEQIQIRIKKIRQDKAHK